MKSQLHDVERPQVRGLKAHRHDEEEEIRLAWESFVRFLRHRNARVTEARRIVLKRVLQRHDHFRADDLAEDLSSGTDRVSRGTIYRTLTLLAQAGIVNEIRDDDMHIHYEHVFGHRRHEHMVCDRCGKFIEFVDPVIEEHIADNCRARRFRPRVHRLVVFGRCEECTEDYASGESADATG